MTERSGTEEIVNRIKRISLIDAAVVEVISLLDDKESNFEQIVEKLTPTITAKFLKMSNSVYYGVSVRTIDHAVRLLGYGGMKQILVTSLLIDHFEASDKTSDFDFKTFQSQSKFCSVVSRVIGDVVGYRRLEDLFTVSMLHNIGKVIIAIYFRDEYEKIQALKNAEKFLDSEAEEKILGLNHAEIGSLVLQNFHIPVDICDAVRYHNLLPFDITSVENYELVMIVREAASIVGRLKLPSEEESLKIIDLLKETVQKSQSLYQEHLKSEVVESGHREVFPSLLKEVSEIVFSDLEAVLKKELI